MSYSFPFSQTDKVIELGGGDRPYFRPNLDVRSGTSIDIVADFNEPLPIPDNEYNGVFSQFCIEHLSWRKVKLFISEVYRILKNNGKVVFITANTEKQMQYVLNHDEWDDNCSCIIFGDQDYPENTHRNSFSPKYAIKLMNDAGFTNVIVLPFGELETDMIIEATKATNKINFDREYFDNPHFYGENTGFYRDHPTNWIVFNTLMQDYPSSVLELGCGRGYLLKRFESNGIPAVGLEISDHCFLTRVTNSVQKFDIRKTPWPFEDKQFDLCFSQGVLDYLNPDIIPQVLKEANRVCKRGIHSVDANKLKLNWENQYFLGNDKIVDGSLPFAVPSGNGKLKLNIGSFTVMLHNGWINTDVIDLSSYAMANQYKFLHMDSRKVFPFESKTVDLIVSSHMLEHIDWNEGLNFLRECYRVMKVGAVMRIAVPDLATMVVKYLNGNLHKLDEINLNAASNDQQSFKFWSYLFDNHKIAYDINSLTKIGNLAGFQVERKGFNEGHPEIIRETMDYLPEISIYVEMTKSV